jgi:hypothetical protein
MILTNGADNIIEKMNEYIIILIKLRNSISSKLFSKNNFINKIDIIEIIHGPEVTNILLKAIESLGK